jgi:Stage II sporulation protein E (SpoIIE)
MVGTARAPRHSAREDARARPARRTWLLRWRRLLPTQLVLLLLLTGVAVGVALLNAVVPSAVPLTSMIVVMMLGGFFLRMRAMMLLYLVIAAGVFFSAARGAPEAHVTGGMLVIIALSALALLLFVRGRERLGVQGTSGEAMLVDLRDRLRAQGSIPSLPREWDLETELHSAYGDSFSGDFLVATRSTDEALLELALVDVSGKGQPAGTRALLLSGAFGGLLGAMEPKDFLAAANAYLMRQGWDEGFATAVHLALDLRTGDYRLASGGHPPPAHYHAGSGLWELLDYEHGPALGVVETEDYPAHQGRLLRGDALLLYTDGMVETPGRDLGLGIDRLMGQAERLVQGGGFVDGARRILDGTGAEENDDRALVLLWRY